MKIARFELCWYWHPGTWLLSVFRGTRTFALDIGPLQIIRWKRKNA